MKSFKHYLAEGKRLRTKEQALKLWNYILKRRKYVPHPEPDERDTENIIPQWSEKHEREWLKQDRHDMSASWERVPMHKIVSAQHNLRGDSVSAKIIGKKHPNWYENNSHIELDYLPKSGVYLVNDGNHKLAKSRLLGKKFVTAKVYRPNN